MNTRSSGYRQLDHTADVALEIWAPTEEALLITGAHAITALLTGGSENSAPRAKRATPSTDAVERRVEIRAVDREDRLVQWLNEILVAAVLDGFLFQDACIELSDDCALSAVIIGRADAHARIVTELKSVTYHDLTIEVSDDEVRAQVVIDV